MLSRSTLADGYLCTGFRLRYIGQRASLPALLLLPSGIFAVLFVATRAAACIPPRSRLQKTDRIATVSFWSPRAGASTEWRVPLLITVGLLGDMVACGRLNLEVCLALRVRSRNRVLCLTHTLSLLVATGLGFASDRATRGSSGLQRPRTDIGKSRCRSFRLPALGTQHLVSLRRLERGDRWLGRCSRACPRVVPTCFGRRQRLVARSERIPRREESATCDTLRYCPGESPDNAARGESGLTACRTARQVGLLLSTALAIAVLLLDLPTYKFFFAPSTIVALGGAASIVGALAVACPLWTLYAAATDTDEDLKPLAIAGGNVYVAGLTVALSYLDRTPEAPTLRVPLAVGLAIALRWCAPGASSNLPLVTSRPSSPVSPAPSYTSSAGQDYSPPSLTGVECDSEQGNYPPSPLSPLSIPPAYAARPSRLSDREWHSVGRQGHVLAIAPFVSILLLVLQPSFTSFFGSSSSHLRHWAPRLSAYNRTRYALGPAPPRVPTLDIVFALYDLDLASFDKHVQHVRGQPALRGYQTRISVYHKGVGAPGAASLEEISKLAGVNEVVPLPNLGREGE